MWILCYHLCLKKKRIIADMQYLWQYRQETRCLWGHWLTGRQGSNFTVFTSVLFEFLSCKGIAYLKKKYSTLNTMVEQNEKQFI